MAISRQGAGRDFAPARRCQTTAMTVEKNARTRCVRCALEVAASSMSVALPALSALPAAACGLMRTISGLFRSYTLLPCACFPFMCDAWRTAETQAALEVEQRGAAARLSAHAASYTRRRGK